MTFSILARCARTGRLGIGTASYTLAVGKYTDAALRPNTGVTFTQGNPNPANNRIALNLLAQGFGPRAALKELLANDEAGAYRQIGVLDREGNSAIHTGAQVSGWSGHLQGENHLLMGCQLSGAAVLEAMAKSFAADPAADLETRLLAVLEAGRDAGGIKGAKGRAPERSVALVVWGRRDYSDLDLRVDMHDTDAIGRLREIFEEFKPYAVYYDERARNPRQALPQMEFADILNKKK
jgi:uncharacterized Ntn-hydrolase superfamily protein